MPSTRHGDFDFFFQVRGIDETSARLQSSSSPELSIVHRKDGQTGIQHLYIHQDCFMSYFCCIFPYISPDL